MALSLSDLFRKDITNKCNKIEISLNTILNIYCGVQTDQIKNYNLGEKIDFINKSSHTFPTDYIAEWEGAKADLSIIRGLRNELSTAHIDSTAYVDSNDYDPKIITFIDTFISKRAKSKFWSFSDTNDSEEIKKDNHYGLDDFPDYYEHNFFGRLDELNFIENALTKRRQPLVVIYGNGGLGKTALVDYFVRQRLETNQIYSKIIWHAKKDKFFNVEKSSIENSVVSKNLNLDTLENIPKKYDFQDMISKKQKALIVLDNVDDYIDESEDFINDYIENFDFLITARVNPNDELGGIRRHLSNLGEEASVNLIKSLASYYDIKDVQRLNDNEARDLVSKLDYSPLYIKWFIAQATKGSSVAEFLNQKKEKYLNFIFSNLLENISNESLLCLKLLNSARKPVTEFLLRCVLRNNNWDVEVNLNKALSELRKSSLVRSFSEDRVTYYEIADNVNHLLSLKNIEAEGLLTNLKTEIALSNEMKSIETRIEKFIGRNINNEMDYTDEYSYEITSPHDALVANEIIEITSDWRYARNKSQSDIDEKEKSFKANENQLKQLNYLDAICPNNFHINFRIGIAYWTMNDLSEAKTKYLKCYEIAKKNNNTFGKKQALHFLITCLDRMELFAESIPYIDALRSMTDNDFNVVYILSQAYWGMGEYDKAYDSINLSLDLLHSSTIGKDFSLKENHILLDQVRRMVSTCNRFLQNTVKHFDSENVRTREAYQQLFNLLEKNIDYFALIFDRKNVMRVLTTCHLLTQDYGRYMSNEGFENDKTFSLFHSKLFAIFKENNKKPFIDMLQNYDPNYDHKEITPEERKEIKQERFLKNKERDLGSEILNTAYAEKKAIQGIIKRMQSSKNGSFTGYMVSFPDGAQAFLHKSLLNPADPKILIGKSIQVIPHKKGANNFSLFYDSKQDKII